MPPRSVSLLRNATLSDGRLVDVEIQGDVVVDVLPAGAGTTSALVSDAAAEAVDLTGYLLLTAPADPHAHLDKALSFDAVQPPFGDLGNAIEAWIAWSADVTVDNIVARAREQVLAMVANGTTAIRSHADVLPGHAARNVSALVEVKAELAHLVDLEIVALCSSFVSDAEVEEALAAGATVLGGAPHLAEDPIGELHRLLAIAERHGVAVDLHTDESLDGPLTLDAYAKAVRDWPRDRQYSAGHCCRLGTLEPAELDYVIGEVSASDIGIITLPITNLYLQGWQHPVATPRGLTALRALLDAGVRVGAGADNVRDPFNPVGRSDAFETASLLITAGHLTPEEAWSLVSDGARSVMGLPAAGAYVGAQADFVAIRATSLLDAIATASAERTVIHRGRLIAETTLTRSLAL